MNAGTFKVIGGDGREYVAEGLNELRAWVADGRVGRETLVWSHEDAAWRRAADRPELRWDLPDAPPILSGSPPASSSGPPSPTAVPSSIPVPDQPLLAPSDAEPAGFGVRLAAGAMDLVLVVVLFNVASLPWADELRGLQDSLRTESQKAIPDMGLLLRANGMVFLPLLLLRTVYSAAFHALAGATPGKLAFHLKLVALDGAAPGVGRVLIRALLETVTLATLGIGFGIMMLGGDGRALHDLLAGTRVVRKKP